MRDNQEHFHKSDRFPSRDTLQWFNSLENVRNISADYIVGDKDDILIVDTTSADVEITLPPSRNGRRLLISNYEGINDVVLTPDGAETVNWALVPPGESGQLKAINGGWLAY